MSDIIFCGINEWRNIKQRPQHLAERLSARHRIVYVNPISYSIATHIGRVLRKRTLRRWLPRLEQLLPQLWLFTPGPALPFSRRIRAVNRLNQQWLSFQLHPVLKRLDIKAPILWATFPPDVDLIGRMHARRIVFDCMDNYAEFFRGTEKTVISMMEHDLIARADLVLATAAPLLEKCRCLNGNAHLVPNGVDAAHFGRVVFPGLSAADDLKRYQRPRFGYVGTIGPWTDLESMIALSLAAPHGSVIVIGPWETPRPPNLPNNMHILGPRPYERLPEYLAGFDVALIPFKVGPLTQAVNPVKLFEYAAAGIPIAATATEELAHYGSWCALAASPQDWVKSAIRLVEEGKPDERRSRAAAEAATYDWKTRTDLIEQLISGL